MNAKYALALILALQVSMSLCEIPAPDQDLVEKYNSYRDIFAKRLANAYEKIQTAAAPVLESMSQGEQGQALKDMIEQLSSRSEVSAASKVAAGMAKELTPIVDRARTAMLGVYGAYVRPSYGQHISDAIDSIRVYLDQYLPAQ
ncbi:apolipoprotein A-II [Aulostomus maculatus]